MQLIRQTRHTARSAFCAALALTTLLASGAVLGGVLPEDRADVLYHRYEGGGVKIDGPSVLVRKKIGEKFAVNANYYIDMVSSASIDVLTTASPYKEKREQKSVGFEYLRGKTTYSLGYINSTESDYVAKTEYFSVAQDMFGDLTTLSFGFSRGENNVFRNIKTAAGARLRDPTFAAKMDTRSFSAGLTQVLTRNMIGTLNYELITDEGFLRSPYRSVRFVDVASGTGYRFGPEAYPNTHTSNAVSARVKYFLPWRGALDGSYRFYTDTWGVLGHTAQIGYTHPVWHKWTFGADYRFYKQRQADFYSDLFPRQFTLNFQARDKELAAFRSQSIGLQATWEFQVRRAPWLEKASANIRFNHLLINYDNFRDITQGGAAGGEPLYKLDANILQVFFSAYF